MVCEATLGAVWEIVEAVNLFHGEEVGSRDLNTISNHIKKLLDDLEEPGK